MSGRAQEDDQNGARYEKATFAGGCFWCMEGPFEALEGVIDVTAGYTGGVTKDPDYEKVSSGQTGHVEAVQITYDPAKISYDKLLEVFWRQIDPTDAVGQFADRGNQYRTAIFYENAEQKRLAEKSKEELGLSGKFSKPIVTPIREAAIFYPAEEHHQDFYKKSSSRYRSYKQLSGRDAYLKKTWPKKTPPEVALPAGGKYQKPSPEEMRKILTSMQYEVTQRSATEPAFRNEFWDNKREGIYVDVVTGEPLFSSRDKYDSGTGWPSFIRPLDPDTIVEKEDRSLAVPRTEVRSKEADSHLGHVFRDGPEPTGMRYCVNSAALRFIPKEDLSKEGYGGYESLFKDKTS